MISTINRTILALTIIGCSSIANAGLIDNRIQLGGWDGSTIDTIGSNNGTIVGTGVSSGTFAGRSAFNFFTAKPNDYVRFDQQSDYALNNGVVAIDFMQTGKWNPRETLFSKDAVGYDNGGHLTIYSVGDGGSGNQGTIKARLQSTNQSFTLTSGLLDLNQWYNLEFAFGFGGMKLAIDGLLVDSNVFTGGIASNLEGFSLGASKWWSTPGSFDDMRGGYSGYISSVGIYGDTRTAIPEPATFILLLAGSLMLVAQRRRFS